MCIEETGWGIPSWGISRPFTNVKDWEIPKWGIPAIHKAQILIKKLHTFPNLMVIEIKSTY
jgi:hypothetical protein